MADTLRAASFYFGRLALDNRRVDFYPLKPKLGSLVYKPAGFESNPLRAVLLTALTTDLGMLPMPIGVLGGLTATAFLTLFVIPIIYSLFERISFKKPKAQAS